MARLPRPVAINEHLLPPQLRLLLRLVGDAAAYRLIEHRGGTSVKVPKRASAGHWLAELLGPVAFGRLVEEMASEVLHLPKYDAVLRQLRHRRVLELVGKHMVREVAAMTGYTTRQVINIRNQAEEDGWSAPVDPNQLDMFADLDSALEATETAK